MSSHLGGRQVGVDMCLDVHGDEALPYIFLAGNEVGLL